MKIKFFLIISGVLNLIVIVERVIYKLTGWFVFPYSCNHPLTSTLVSSCVWLTIFLLLTLIFRTPPTWRTRSRKATLIAFTLLYIVFGLPFWLSTQYNFSSLKQETAYSSPNGYKEVVFQEMRYFNYVDIKTYVKRGVFQKHVLNEPADGFGSLRRSIGDESLTEAFHDPSRIQLIWSEDERSLRWIIDSSIMGIVKFNGAKH